MTKLTTKDLVAEKISTNVLSCANIMGRLSIENLEELTESEFFKQAIRDNAIVVGDDGSISFSDYYTKDEMNQIFGDLEAFLKEVNG